MSRIYLILAVVLMAASSSAIAWYPNLMQGSSGGSSSRPFALPNGDSIHYMAAPGSCNDTYDGLAQTHTTGSTGPWCSANHVVHCGDVIVALAGTYTKGVYTFAQPTNCPSTTGGIDGAGGIHFAIVLCGGADLEACPVNCSATCTGGGNPSSIFMNADNGAACCWSFQGFKIQGGGAGSYADSFQVYACHEKARDIALINDISWNSASGYGINGCGTAFGGDYFFVVMSIVYNSALSPQCLAALDAVGLSPWDTAAGTHIFFAGNFAIKNDDNVQCTDHDGPNGDIDVEGIMCDTCGGNSYTNQIVFTNNIVYQSHRMGIHIIGAGGGGPTILVFGNTGYANNDGPSWSDAGSGGAIGDLQPDGTQTGWTTKIWSNIFQSIYTVTPSYNGHTGYGQVYALHVSGSYSSLQIGAGVGAGLENVLKGARTSCTSGVTCDSGFNASYYPGTGVTLGTNIYTDPLFRNTTDLLANQVGVPNCTGYTNVTACMGWNAALGAARNPSVIYDLTPTCSQCANRGYQPPGACVNSGTYHDDFPADLKGVVYLHWTGTAVVQNLDGVTLPCGL